MNPNVKKKWVEALRSGKYKQGTRYLRLGSGKNTSFCCLGVLCNLHAESHPATAKREKSPTVYMGEISTLPDAVMKWAGLSTPNGKFEGRIGGYKALTGLNDSGDWNFDHIAYVIETQF